MNDLTLAKPAAPSPFSSTIPQLQEAWDSTSLGWLKTCDRYYYLTMIEGWRKKHTSIHLTFGLVFHSALEAFDHAKAKGADHQEAVRAATRQALSHGRELQLALSDDPNKNLSTLVRSVIWYCENFREDTCETVILANGRAAVELSFKMEIPQLSPDGKNYMLCGHIDRLVMFGNEQWVLDRKTTKTTLSPSFFDKFNPSNQMTLYTLATKIILDKPARGVIIDAAQIAVGFTRFQRSISQRTPAQLDEWLRDTVSHIKRAEINAQEQYWPMNDTSCDKFGGCPFRGVCSKDPAVREMFLNAEFEKKQWNPLESRGEE